MYTKFLTIKKSSVHGNGAFAKHFIPIGTRICYYDMNSILSYDMNNVLKRKCMNTAKHSVFADCINDFARPAFPHENEEILNDGTVDMHDAVIYCLEQYILVSTLVQNVEYNHNDSYLYASKNIDRGEELFLSYGIKYWLIDVIPTCKLSLYRLLYIYYLDKKLLNISKNVINYLKWYSDSEKWQDFWISEDTSESIKAATVLRYLKIPLSSEIINCINLSVVPKQ